VPAGLPVTNVVRADQIKSLAWRTECVEYSDTILTAFLTLIHKRWIF